MDLTRSITNKSVTESDSKETPSTRKLAFSVENILDPNKFTGKKIEKFHRAWNGYDDIHEKHDDEHSESQSGGIIKIYSCNFNFILLQHTYI